MLRAIFWPKCAGLSTIHCEWSTYQLIQWDELIVTVAAWHISYECKAALFDQCSDSLWSYIEYSRCSRNRNDPHRVFP